MVNLPFHKEHQGKTQKVQTLPVLSTSDRARAGAAGVSGWIERDWAGCAWGACLNWMGI